MATFRVVAIQSIKHQKVLHTYEDPAFDFVGSAEEYQSLCENGVIAPAPIPIEGADPPPKTAKRRKKPQGSAGPKKKRLGRVKKARGGK